MAQPPPPPPLAVAVVKADDAESVPVARTAERTPRARDYFDACFKYDARDKTWTIRNSPWLTLHRHYSSSDTSGDRVSGPVVVAMVNRTLVLGASAMSVVPLEAPARALLWFTPSLEVMSVSTLHRLMSEKMFAQ